MTVSDAGSDFNADGEADAETWVLSLLEEQTEDTEWSSRRNVLAQARKEKTPLTKQGADRVIEALVDDNQVLSWHGLLTPATEKRLLAVIEAEHNADFTRRILVSQASTLLQEVRS